MLSVLLITFPFFALVLCGYLAARRGVLPQPAIPGLNAFVLYFALPCMLYRFGASTPIGRGRMLRRRLQKGEVQLEPVVGSQGSFDPRGHQQRGLSQGRNRFFLEHQEFLR